MPLRQVPLEEIKAKIAEEDVSGCRARSPQKRRERDNAIKDKVMSSLGFVADRVEGDAY